MEGRGDYRTVLWEPGFEHLCAQCAGWVPCLKGVGTVSQGHCHSAEPEAQPEEQVGKNKAGELAGTQRS